MPEDGGYEISTDRSRIDFDKVHSWLAGSYWSPGVSMEVVKKAAENSSLLVGAYVDAEQVGYLRVISDKATFGWIADVWVDEAVRGRGIAKAMVQAALVDPEHLGFRRWVLATRNAHPIYAACGFIPLDTPERWMVHYPGK